MKASVILLFSVLLMFTVAAQDNKLSIGIVGGADMFSNKVNSKSNWDGYKTPPSDYGYHYGLHITYQTGKRMGIRAGVVYARKEFQKKAVFWIMPRNGISRNPLRTYQSNYLEIPISVYYDVIQRDRFQLAPTLGIKTGVFINGKSFTDQDPNSAHGYEPEDESRFIIGPRIGIMANFNIIENLSLSLEPNVAFSYSSFYLHSNQRISAFWGISLSLNYGLKN